MLAICELRESFAIFINIDLYRLVLWNLYIYLRVWKFHLLSNQTSNQNLNRNLIRFSIMGLQIEKRNTVSAAKKVSAVVIRLSNYGKPNMALTSSQKWSGSFNFTHDYWLSTEKIMRHTMFIFYCPYDITRENLIDNF